MKIKKQHDHDFTFQAKGHGKNPAYRRHQLSRPMRIVGPIQFWRGCVIYRSAPKSGLGPCENADSVHAKVGTRSTQKCWLCSLRNTSPFLGLYSKSGSRLRSNSGTHAHIVSFWKFYRIGGAPPETFPNVKYDAPQEMGGDRKCFDSPIMKWGLFQIFDVNSSRAFTLCIWTFFCCP